MRAANVRRWQWMLVGTALGVAVAAARAIAGTDAAGLGALFNDTRVFERSLGQEFHGRRQFTDLVVYPVRVEGPAAAAGGPTAYLVAGKFYDGTPRVRDGRLEAVWEPRCFVAPVPYRPVTAGAPALAPGGTVLDYLAGRADVSYRYAWWCDLKAAVPAGGGAGFVLLGLVWPTVVNLLAFGRLTRPAEEPVVAAPQGAPSNAIAVPVPAVDDGAAIAALNEAIERELAEGLAADPGPGVRPDTLSPAPSDRPAPAVTAKPLEPVATGPQQVGPSFGMGEEDYYPTVLRPPSDP